MKSAICFVLFLAFGVCELHAQELQNVWQVVNTSVTDGPLVFTTNDSGFIGTPANLYVTADGGRNFTSRPMPAAVFNMEIKDMCWPTSRDGYLLFLGNNGTSSSLAQTSDAGNNWNVVNLSANNLIFYSISFPVPGIGYATGQVNQTNGGYFVAKTTNNGADWSIIKNTTLSVGPILFKNVLDGMFVVFDAAGVPQISYTFDSMQHINNASTIPFGTQGEQSSFLRWNDDGSWIVQYEGLVRSSDSGKNWATVLPNDPSGQTGTISTACFYGNRGLAFGDNSIDFQSTDYGSSWHQFTNTAVGGASYTTYENTAAIPSETSAMPSDTAAFTLAQGDNGIALLGVSLPPAAVAQTTAVAQDGLEVMQRGIFFQFTSTPEAGERNIEIYDVLGRACAVVPLAPMSQSATLRTSSLMPGTYFARLGNSIAKFTVWQ